MTSSNTTACWKKLRNYDWLPHNYYYDCETPECMKVPNIKSENNNSHVQRIDSNLTLTWTTCTYLPVHALPQKKKLSVSSNEDQLINNAHKLIMNSKFAFELHFVCDINSFLSIYLELRGWNSVNDNKPMRKSNEFSCLIQIKKE